MILPLAGSPDEPSCGQLEIGLDVGSTTVKAMVLNAADEILWQDYRRHETRQAETVLEMLSGIEADLGARPEDFRIHATGSGAGSLAPHVGARLVQEVNAVSLAVEKLHPEAGSVIELGGQDAKIIIFKRDPEGGRVRKIFSMNDKCAGGTGAVIDKINAKLGIPEEDLAGMGYTGHKLHPVAGKCGVFAETDINGLQKMGVAPPELMASLFDAIVAQNLTVLTRGNTLLPEVLLLGGPNTFIQGMLEAWRARIPEMWRDRDTELPADRAPEALIKVPANAHYFAALGAIEFGRRESDTPSTCTGTGGLERYLASIGEDAGAGGSRERRGLCDTADELDAFLAEYTIPPFHTKELRPGSRVEAFLGLDGGSTSTKAVLLDSDGEVIAKSYRLSGGNPIEDTKGVIADLQRQIEATGADLEVQGVGTTGYAKDVLRDVIGADAALVETVAHTEAALHFYDDVDVICDVGGQDIKIMVLADGRVKDFKLNTQCSAGNGYFLQSTSQSFGIPIEEFAGTAFTADGYPEFGYGCAVFMQSDIVDFQRKGWQPGEIMAGLAAVLPKNIWLYVAQIPNLPALGRTFLLQGGTQRNLAAVKTQVDFIRSRFEGTGVEPSVIVHRHCGESGAIGAALEARRLRNEGRETTFIGFEAVRAVGYTTHRNEDTRCFFCKNQCLRTFIDVSASGTPVPGEEPRASKIPLEPGSKRLIVGNSCDRGLVEDVEQMKQIKRGMDEVKDENPNLADLAGDRAWRSFEPEAVSDPPSRVALTTAARRRRALLHGRESLRIGIPRVLNQYSVNPFFSAYLESLGVRRGNIVYSDFTNEELYKEGARRGAIDPCFPSKVALAHVHNLLTVKHAKRPLDLLFFPMIRTLATPLVGTVDTCACPTVTATPETVKAAFTKEGDRFGELGIRFLDPVIDIGDPDLCERQMLQCFGPVLGLSGGENRRATSVGLEALERFDRGLRDKGREVLRALEREGQLGIVVLGRPYHNDPGINHGILEDLQALGYPILTQDALPLDPDTLAELFREDLDSGAVEDPLAISDVWKNAYSENTNRKVWAAKFTARHPNLVALELSSFKCGHDAPIYSLVEEIIERSGTPYFSFKDIDENKPAGSIKIRIETIDYFLGRYRDFVFGAGEVGDGTSAEASVVGSTLKAEMARYGSLLRGEAPARDRARRASSATCGSHGADAPDLVQITVG